MVTVVLAGAVTGPLLADGTIPGTSDHWSFQPVVRPAVPQAGRRPVHPVDAFLRAALQERGLKASTEADRTTRIRRLYDVMLGLPPTPEEIEAFRRDRSTRAWESLVDRVLEDPRYGERWARHWLDVVRFAESNGYETNRERTTAWRFRDWVIQALNSDLPYDRFVREQIAGDSLGADVATGFLVGGPWDIVKSPDPALTAQQRADELDDMVNTTGTSFLGLTLGCARCHSHKFDPVSQREYYSLTAIFAGVQQGERALPRSEAEKADLLAAEVRVKNLEAAVEKYRVRPETSAGPLLPTVEPRLNEDAFPPVTAKRLRFTVLATTGGEPCLDELEVWSGDHNVALASQGTRATASGTLPGYEIHQLAHIHDGKTGNDHSWISNEEGKGWIELEFPEAVPVQRVTWGRDRQGQLGDRLATRYRIEVAGASGGWHAVSDSSRRRPRAGQTPPEPEYRFDGLAEREARKGREQLAELGKARKHREELARPPMIHAGSFTQPGKAHRLHRGDPLQPREEVVPATLELFHPVMLTDAVPERDRRKALADWITRPDHPLTARVMVNRLWQHHFGVGLVDTSNDFGRNGSRPSHPELLDWLAAEFVEPSIRDGERPAGAWSIKHVHRLILTSAAWNQSSTPRPEAQRVDAGNRLLWRFEPRRLEAEAIRDGILAVSGTLDLTAGGPSFHLHDVDRENVYHYHPKERFGRAESRRMVYAFKVRMEQDGVFGAFDCPDGSLVAPRRSRSTTPLQALNLFNSRFLLDEADHFAGRLRREAGESETKQIRRAWQLAYGRKPSRAEISDALALAHEAGMNAVCRAVLNSNEFLFVP
jgi:hypothetical protein